MRFGDFRAFWAAVWADMFSQTRISRAGTDDNVSDIVRLSSEDALPFPRVETFGEFMGPPDETECLLLQKGGGGGAVWVLGIQGLRPIDVKTGDRGLYCDVQDTQLRLHGSGSATPGAIELKRADGSAILLSDGGDVVLTDQSGHTATLSGGVLTVSTDVVADSIYSEHFAGQGQAPTIAAGSALGGGGTAALMPGATDAAFVVQLVAGMSPSVGEVCTVTFARSYGSQPRGVNVTGAILEALIPPVAGSFGYDASASTDAALSVLCGTALTSGTTYYISVSILR